MRAEDVRMMSLVRGPAFLFGFALAFVPQAAGQALPTTTPCHPLGNRGIVRAARDEVDGGASIESVTNALACVARDKEGHPRTIALAVRAGFALQEDDANARSFLFAFIADAEALSIGDSVAWELLTSIADEEAENAMFEIFLNRWASRPTPTYFTYLRALKNQQFLSWLDTRLELGDHAPIPRSMLEAEAELIRVQQDGERVLAYITSPEHPVLYRAWLARHALRCGLTQSEVRDACLVIFQQQAATGTEYLAQTEILKALDELHALDDDHNAILESLRVRRARHGRIRDDYYKKQSWAERIIAARRAAFLKVPRNQGSGQ